MFSVSYFTERFFHLLLRMKNLQNIQETLHRLVLAKKYNIIERRGNRQILRCTVTAPPLKISAQIRHGVGRGGVKPRPVDRCSIQR